MRLKLRSVSWVVVGWLALPASAQFSDSNPQSARELRREAGRQVRYLELPGRRGAASVALLKLGKHAVGPLGRGLSDPRPEIVLTCLHLLHDLGATSRPAQAQIAALAESDNLVLARAAAWARARIELAKMTLVADYGANAVRGYDPAGQRILAIEKQVGVWDVEAVGKDRYLCALYLGGTVVEIDAKGKVHWSYKVRSPLDVDRLPNGNTLISQMHTRGVIEVDRKGKTVWKHDVQGQAYDADRLPSGNTLIADYSRSEVFEVTPKGTRVFTVKAQGVFGADRLPSGNTLLCLYGGGAVREVDPKGVKVWELKVRNPNEARRLANGNTLVALSGSVTEFSPKGERVRTWKSARAGTVHAY